MAVDALQWSMIVSAKCKGRALSAGYPDLLISRAEIEAAIKDGEGTIREREDSQAVQDHHGFAGRVYDSQDVFKAIGLTLEVIDRAVIHGSERIVDLNDGESWVNGIGDAVCMPQLLGQYDLVIDPGTTEHCFNIAQAFVNLADAVRVGGCIFHGLPMAMHNHGYWNVNPVALLDFYALNGFKVERCLMRNGKDIFEPPLKDMHTRLVGVPEGAVVLLLARRLERKAFQWPQQAA